MKNPDLNFLSNLDKVYWPKEKITKGDLIDYYEKIAPYILPYLKNRPVMLHRLPEGIEREGFYQKQVTSQHPKWLKTFTIKHTEKPIEYLVINNTKSLLYAINLGSIDLHPFLATIDHLEYPSFCVIDLDPHEIPFGDLIKTALTVHEVLESSKIDHYCKTSGGKGLHICIPLHAKYTFDQSREFAEVIASYVEERLPNITSMEREPKKRLKRVYLDCLQNRFAQTLACTYTVRPRPFAPVSTPLFWEEVNSRLKIEDFNIKTVPERLKSHGDIFKPVLGRGISMPGAIKRLEKQLS